MNFKIENNFLNITNYPSLEKHFADMASQGWLIWKITLENIFIYKKIEPEKLEFSISPYEVETAYTRKTKEELEEFQSVCRNVGWNYASKYQDFHIYFKEKGRETLDMETDEEEKFKTLEKIGRKQLIGFAIIIPLFLLLGWMILDDFYREITFLKDGFAHILLLSLFVLVLSMINKIITFERFLRKNRERIELGQDIKFDKSKMNFQKIAFILYMFLILLLITYMFYSVFVLKVKLLLASFLPILAIYILVYILRIKIKSSKKSLDYKRIAFFLIIIFAILVNVWWTRSILYKSLDDPTITVTEGLRVVSVSDFSEENIEVESNLYKDISIFIPESYDYYSYDSTDKSIETQYSRALNEAVAENLVERYIKHSKKWPYRLDIMEVEEAFLNEEYDKTLEEYGLSQEEFDKLNSKKDKDPYEAAEEAMEIMRSKAISRDKENLWGMEEVYFLNIFKEEVLIRQGKEVIYLRGQDFGNPENIKIIKNKLDLN